MATIIESFVGSCAKKLQDIVTEEAILILGVKEELIDLQRKMEQIQCFLNDAEQRSIKESAVNYWLGQLRDAMYDADDIIDLAKSKGSKLLPDHSSSFSSSSKTCSGLSLSSCFSNIQTRHEVAVKIRNLNKRIDNIKKDEVFASFKITHPAVTVLAPNQRRSSSLVELNLVGKEVIHACRKLVDLVFAQRENRCYKLAIVGMGGVGKTTLAQKIYDDQKLKVSFNRQAWVCVSKDFSEIAILKEILRQIDVQYMQDESTNELQRKLQLAIKDKSFFLVLDDVWQSDTWTNLLRTPLHAASSGVVILTTRSDTIAVETGADHTHRVDLLSMDVGWELLWRSMGIKGEEEVQNLQNLGIDIVRRCGGLPLAIKVIARVLASKDPTENEWKKILGKDAWSVTKLPSEITSALYLSYEELPHHLKQCFIYCALYPEDSTIYRNDIVRMWVAEGFIDEQDDRVLEDIAEEYYYELIYRNLLQPDYTYSVDLTLCRMHDLLRQLACHLSREELFVGDPNSAGVTGMSKFRRILAVAANDMVVLPRIDKGKCKVRTWRTVYTQSLGFNVTIFERLPCIRVLDLINSQIQNVPSCIGRLIHLRLLDLDGTDVSSLPESICCLINLQILNLQRCDSLHSLPSGITQLCNLRRLGLAGSPINEVPHGIGRLTFLNDLEGFPVHGGSYNNSRIQDGWNLEELDPLLQLRRLDVINLERAVCPSKDSLLSNKNHLRQLILSCSEIHEPYSEDAVINIEKTFDLLVPARNLEDLIFRNFSGRWFPTWLGTATNLPSLTYLNLQDCKSCVHIPPIGQLPNLKYLYIDGAIAVTRIGPEFVASGVGDLRYTEAVAFPKLETLIIRDMPNWEEWSFVAEEKQEATTASMEGAQDEVVANQKGDTPPPRIQLLPRLKTLELKRCPKLRALPPQLGQQATCLKEVQLRKVHSLKVVENLCFVSELLLIADCGGLERVSNLPQVTQLRVQRCPNLMCVERVDNMHELFLTDDMKEISLEWLPGLQEKHQQQHGEDMDVYTWIW